MGKKCSFSQLRGLKISTVCAAALVVIFAALSTSGLSLSSARSHGAIPFPPRSTCVAAPGGINCIKVRTWASTRHPATDPTVIFLDGLRATWRISGWEHDTNVQMLAQNGVNVVEPVGGDASFYSDWLGPSKTNNQQYTYMWESFLTNNLPPYLDSLGFSRNYSLVGISMGGTAAIFLAAHHPHLFKRAASLSGFLHTTDPNFSEILRISMLSQNGFDMDAMWGPPGSPAWYQHDPYQLIPALTNTPLWISSGNGVPSNEDSGVPADQVFNGVVIEATLKMSAVQFRDKARANGLTKAKFFFPERGVHNWAYWQDQVWAMQRTHWFYQT